MVKGILEGGPLKHPPRCSTVEKITAEWLTEPGPAKQKENFHPVGITSFFLLLSFFFCFFYLTLGSLFYSDLSGKTMACTSLPAPLVDKVVVCKTIVPDARRRRRSEEFRIFILHSFHFHGTFPQTYWKVQFCALRETGEENWWKFKVRRRGWWKLAVSIGFGWCLAFRSLFLFFLGWEDFVSRLVKCFAINLWLSFAELCSCFSFIDERYK